MRATSKIYLLTPIFAALCATNVAAEFKYETRNGGTALFYGQLDPAYLSFDDGVSTTNELVDNTNSNSRVGFWYRLPTDTGEFAINLETSFGLRASGAISQNSTIDDIRWERTSIRKVEAIWNDTRFGTFAVGQGSMSSDGASSQDLSGTALVLYNSIPDTAGAFVFRTTTDALSAKTISQAFGSFDGGRKARVRYDTPSYGGLSLSVSYGQEVLSQGVDEDVADLGLFYSGDSGSFKMVGALAYSKVEFGSGLTRHDTIGSFSVLHDTGFNVTLAAGHRNEAGSYVYGKLGYKGDWLSIGTTAVAIDYYTGNDKTSVGSDSASIGIGIVQSIDKANVDAYLGYRTYSLSETAQSYRDASSVLFGARWKF